MREREGREGERGRVRESEGGREGERGREGRRSLLSSPTLNIICRQNISVESYTTEPTQRDSRSK